MHNKPCRERISRSSQISQSGASSCDLVLRKIGVVSSDSAAAGPTRDSELNGSDLQSRFAHLNPQKEEWVLSD